MKIGGIEVHKSVTLDRVMEAVERHNVSLDNPGNRPFMGPRNCC
jgi:hypothetical protein